MSIRKFITDLGLDPNNFTLYKAALAFVIFFMPIFWTEIGIIALIFLDFGTGVLASRKLGIPLTSARASRTVYKFLVYTALLCTCLIAERLTDIDIFVKCATFFLTLAETMSVAENMRKILNINFISYLKAYLEGKVKGVSIEEVEKAVEAPVEEKPVSKSTSSRKKINQ